MLLWFFSCCIFVAFALPELKQTENAVEILQEEIKRNERIYKSGASVPFFAGVEEYQFRHRGIASTVLGKTAMCDPGVCQRYARVMTFSRLLIASFILSSHILVLWIVWE
jgi:hypothetical protein